MRLDATHTLALSVSKGERRFLRQPISLSPDKEGPHQ